MKFKISKFSKMTGLSIKALRVYERAEILVPARSGHKYRLYSFDQVEVGRRIKSPTHDELFSSSNQSTIWVRRTYGSQQNCGADAEESVAEPDWPHVQFGFSQYSNARKREGQEETLVPGLEGWAPPDR